ncbi:hypothetical protein [Roseibium sediminis]|uniref:hypothetical protein n=1 Tax=Roseibium sediminis TaxID=1775174 RepID=UPI00123E0A2D|nr:hypothetical protein [Roseibium sediminis]
MLLRLLSFVVVTSFLMALPAASSEIDFGDDAGEYAKDGECEDRRFIGLGMGSLVSAEAQKHDATDCKRLFDAGLLKLVDGEKGRNSTVCSKINFGDNSSEYADDGECDDYRFDGTGADAALNLGDLARDKNDCKKLCESGAIWLRVPAD